MKSISSCCREKLSVVHISYMPHFRGGENQVLLLHKGLLDSKIESSIISSKMGKFNDVGSQAQVLCIPYKKSFSLFFPLVTIFSWIYRKKPILLHCHDPGSLNIGVVVSLVYRIKLIYSRKALYPIRNNWINRWKFRRCVSVVAVSTAVRDVCVTLCNTEKVTIIHDGIRLPEQSEYSSEKARQKLGIQESAFVIGTVGYFTREKNFPLLLELAKELESLSSVVIACLGYIPAPYRESAMEHRNMICMGIVPDAVNYYAAFNLYVSTSILEGLGSALLDAIVRGIPVVAMDAGGTQDIFQSRGRFMIPRHDNKRFVNQVHNCIENYEEAQSYALELAKECRERFSLEGMVEKHIKLYRKCVNNKR